MFLDKIKILFARMEDINGDPAKITLDTVVPVARLFNPDAETPRYAAAIFGSDTDGIIDPTNTPYTWANSLWDMMVGNDWAPSEVDVSADIDNLRGMSKEVQWSYERVLHALIANDSEQTRNIPLSIMPYISDGVVQSCLARQTFEEANHSKSYDVMVKDVAIDRERLYNLHNEDEFVKYRATYLEKMYAPVAYARGSKVTLRMLMRALIANNVLEGIMFYAGFIFIWGLGDKLQGSASMVSFIARDERTHIQLFRKMFLSMTAKYPGLNIDELEETAIEIVHAAAELEKKWLKYVGEGVVPGFTETAIDRYINGKADAVLRGLKFNAIYNDPVSPLLSIEKQFDDPNSVKANFFEARPNTYTSTIPTTEGYITKKGERSVYYPPTNK